MNILTPTLDSYIPFFLVLQPCKAKKERKRKKGKERKKREGCLLYNTYTCLGLLPAHATNKTLHEHDTQQQHNQLVCLTEK